MGNKQNPTSAHSHSTTEELIVAYLDGELVRKELEVVLFERLASHPDARKVLREHLTMRGAIHNSEQDARFQLKAGVDQRTRTRLQAMLKQVPQLVEPPVLVLAKDRKRAVDSPIIATKPTERRIKLWSKRLAPTLLLLLIAVGTTWYVTRSTDNGIGSSQLASNSNVGPSAPPTSIAPASVAPTIPTPTVTPSESTHATSATEPTERVKIVKEYIKGPIASSQPGAKDVAQNTVDASPSTAAQSAPKQDAFDPRDVMISRRYPKMIHATTAVMVTQQDRL